WHYLDETPQSQQMIQLTQERRRTFTAVIDLSANTVKPLANADMPTVTTTDDMSMAIGLMNKPYRGTVEWGASKADIYRINVATGEKTLVEPGLSRTLGFSTDNKWFLYLK